MNNATAERKAFSTRLSRLLVDRGYKKSCAVLTREFNSRTDGPPVTACAARKWLLGEAIPRQEKLLVLAVWLGVSAAWLRYGRKGQIDHGQVASGKNPAFSPDDQLLLRYAQRLNPTQRRAVINLMRDLASSDAKPDLRINRKKGRRAIPNAAK